MIDIKNAEKEFIKYTENYDLSNENIERKQLHSIRVMKLSTQIAKSLNLSEDETDLATLIGLLHDIARFEQYSQYKTYEDVHSFDHGDYGVKILNKDIRKYIETEKYDNIIKTAIKNHNKLKIEEGLSEKELLFSKIIRDADKIDIIYEGVEIFWRGQDKNFENSIVSDFVLNQFKNNSLVKREKDIEINKILIPINNEIIKISNYLNEKSNYLQKIEKEIVDINELYNKLLNKYQQLNSKKEELNELNIIKNKLQNNKKIYDQIEENNKYIESFNKDELNNIINNITKLEELTKDNTISNKLENALKEQNETNKKINEYKEILKEIEKIENNLEKDYITLNIEKTKEKDLSNEYEHAEILFLKNQAGFLASMLKDNEPCMVCGSVNHPNKAILNNESITKNELDNLRSKLEKQIEIRNYIINRIAINNSLLEEKNKEKIVTELNKLTLIDFKIDELKNKEKEYLLNIEELKILKNKYDELKEIETNIKIKKANNNSLKESLFIYDDSLENVITKISELTNYIFKIDKEYNETLNSKNVLEKEIILVKNDIELKNKELNNLNIEFNKHNYNKELFTNNQLRELEIEYNEYYKEYDKVNTLIDNLKDKVKDKKIINIDNYINELNILNKQYDELLNNDTMLRYKTNKKVYENIVEQYNKNIDINKNYSMYKILSDTANGTISGKSKILFEQYVQSTYFNEIIKNSNYRLDIMTLGRYELRKKNDQQNLKDKVGLDLEVMDNYTGKIRDIKSLSGGESFKASLSLALGLSDTIQNYAGGIVVDTMFIDEGFGSLDSDSLEQALKTLNDLTSNNCLIGIISHVNELKQRIDKKIIVSKSTSGSTIKIEG